MTIHLECTRKKCGWKGSEEDLALLRCPKCRKDSLKAWVPALGAKPVQLELFPREDA